MRIVINAEECIACGACITACPVEAIYLDGPSAKVVEDKCDLDGICILSCRSHLPGGLNSLRRTLAARLKKARQNFLPGFFVSITHRGLLALLSIAVFLGGKG